MRLRDLIDELQQTPARPVGMSVQHARTIEVSTRKLLAQIHAALKDEERKLEDALPDRIAAVLTTALALGVVIGWALRKR
jgi:hypothetical protein